MDRRARAEPRPGRHALRRARLPSGWPRRPSGLAREVREVYTATALCAFGWSNACAGPAWTVRSEASGREEPACARHVERTVLWLATVEGQPRVLAQRKGTEEWLPWDRLPRDVPPGPVAAAAVGGVNTSGA